MPSQRDVINTILAEAGNSPQGMAAVAHVINNRAAQRGLTPAQVVAQSGQFEAYTNPSPGGVANQQNPALRAQAEQIWQGVQNGTVPDPTAGGTQYFGDYIAPPTWARGAVAAGQTANIGGQTFLLGSGTSPPMNVPAVGSDYANTGLPIPMAPRSDTAQQAVTNPDGSVNWGAFYQGLAAPAQLATGPTASPVGGDFAALGMQGQNPSLAAALAGYAAPSAPITDAASAADFYSGFGLGPASAQSATPSMTLGDQLAFNPINVPDSTLAMGSPNANYGDALTNNTSFAAYPQGATADSGAVPLSNFLASIGAAPTVGAPPVTTPVHSVAIGANGQPVIAGTPAASQGLTEAQQLAMLALPAAGGVAATANPGAGYTNLYGQGSAPGALYTGQGIAGTAQLPADYHPAANLMPSLASIPESSSNNSGGNSDASQSWTNLINSFDATPSSFDIGSINDAKDQSQLPQGSGLSFAGPVTATTAPTTRQVLSQQLNPAYQAWVDNQNSAIYGVEGVPSPSLDASGNVVLPSSYLGAAPAATAAPAKYIPITKTITVPGKTIAAAPALGIAAAPVVQAPIAAPNGYLYAPAVGGGYTQVGQSAQYAGMTPSQQYAAAAAPALASQTNLGGGGGNHDSQNRAGGGLTG